MIGSPLRTISGRILLGFFVLLATFGGVCAHTIAKMQQLGRSLTFIRTAYLEVSLTAAQLSTMQGGLVDNLEGATLPRSFVKRNVELRRRLLEDSVNQLRTLEAVPVGHEEAIEAIAERIEHFLEAYQQNQPLFDLVFSSHAAPEARSAAVEQLARSEKRLRQQMNQWFNDLKTIATETTMHLERAERQASVGAIGLGATAAVLALLVTVWAILTLRPLRRLRDGVRNVARGNYRERLALDGGTEVADLAREFNAMAAAIEEREQELVRSERLAAVGKMAAVITHEVRNPLSSIGLNAELLEEELRGLPAGASSTEAVALCRAIEKEVDRLTAITEEYLRFARMPRPRLEREQLNSIVAELVEFQREELDARGVEVVTSLADGLPAVAADDAQLRQALLNLMRNAADAMAPAGGGRLAITTRSVGEGAVEVSVADTGPGISQELMDRIFEPFFSTKEKGTGLGLALTQQIVAEHGGRIEVSATSGEGTTFVVRLPTATAASAAA